MPAIKRKAAGVPKGAPVRVRARVARKAGKPGPLPIVRKVAKKAVKKAPAKKKAAAKVAKKVPAKKKKVPRPVNAMIQTHPWLFELGYGASSYHHRRVSTPTPRRIDGVWEENQKPNAAHAPRLKKSWDLLMEHLDDTQKEDLLTKGMFTVVNTKGTNCLVIANISHLNVFEKAASGAVVNKWCTADASGEMVPIWDIICAQVLAIKYNWDYFTKIAFSLS